MNDTSIDSFSTSYALVDGVDIVSHSGDRAILDDELHADLSFKFGRPVAKFNNAHYELAASGSVPSNTAALPAEVHSKLTDAAKGHLLIAKQGMPL